MNLAVLFSAATLLASSTASAQIAGDYDSLYPKYAEFCAASQIMKNKGFGATVEGGRGGHGFIYLQGACRDMQATYPRIVPCEQGGVGVSVNSDFKNVNWIATQSKTFFLQGDVSPGTRISQDVYLRVQARAKELDLLRGVEFHSELLTSQNKNKPPEMSGEQYMWEDTFATDYAVSMGRNVYCTKIPVTIAMMNDIIQKLNEDNEQYFRTGRPYQWSGIMDNCTHTTHNALAAALVWAPLATHKMILFQLFNLAIPGDDFIDLLRRGNEMDLSSPLWTFSDPVARASLMKYDWLPTQHGVMPELYPIQQPTELYRTDLKMLFLELPLIEQDRRAVKRMTRDPRTTDLATNLRWFITRYQDALQQIEPLSYYTYLIQDPEGNWKNLDVEEFKEFYPKYLNWLKNQLSDAQNKLRFIE